MRTFAHRLGQHRQSHPGPGWEPALGKPAAQRLRQSDGGNEQEHAPGAGLCRGGHDFSHIPTHCAAPARIQTKLTVSAPGDRDEQEADRVADMVMQAPGQDKRAGLKGIEDEDEPMKSMAAEKALVQRSTSRGAAGPALDAHTANRIEAMRGGGRALSAAERGFMEPRFGADFSAIKIHTNHEADAHSRALRARAFTLGQDIFFRGGAYTPGNADSRRLLAHELTHTIQQGAAGSRHSGARDTAARQLQRQADAGVPAVAPVGLAALNFLPVIMDQIPAGWGVTAEDDAVIDITAFASGASWKCVITTANQQARQGVRLLPGVTEVTAASVAAEASCATLQTMITSLNTVANQGAHSGFYMLSAVQAHENLHITQYRGDIAPHYATLKTAVEALSVPAAGIADAAAAKAAIKALPAFTAAMATFHAGDVAANNKTAAHTLAASFNVVEHAVVDPMIATIRTRKTALACPP
ncbi:DUF4157 domain-containing protein [Janthinobacterium fluminis]|uniref:DUF4157 domain-containing protein n=1 Tax=Janthinobacterium fluminis TaxID=2987524 RepID=A0ABT5JZ88_9BURK|nr:DUF4157 domain-containing protein [Janthinobacterium fluminis]MDC8758041.1 DUF4157 domain-containing protein [Janthinobacterium fluminis]